MHQTAGLTLEEIGASFGDVVQLSFDEAVAQEIEEKRNVDLVESVIELKH